MASEAADENVAGDTPDISETIEGAEATVTETGELERTLGLSGGLAIGIGTMIGAGVFVLPGLAGAQVGTAATASFGVGGIIALLVALPTSELATAMPKSGGGYYFISRGLGTLAGTIVGLSLWLGLVFATAFYLVGLGFYALDALAEAGIVLAVSEGAIVSILAVVFGIGFTASVEHDRNRKCGQTPERHRCAVALDAGRVSGLWSRRILWVRRCWDASHGSPRHVGSRSDYVRRCTRLYLLSRFRAGGNRRRRDEEPGSESAACDDWVGADCHDDARPDDFCRDECLRPDGAGGRG